MEPLVREALGVHSDPAATVRIGSLPDAVVDPVLARPLWGALVDNAIAAARPGEAPRLEIHGELRDGVAHFMIRDHGVGFDERVSAKIFEPFQTPRPAPERAGVGLAIARCIVHKHGGAMSAASSPGDGTTVRFSLPA
jgi:signal transduction histidine kinase